MADSAAAVPPRSAQDTPSLMPLGGVYIAGRAADLPHARLRSR